MRCESARSRHAIVSQGSRGEFASREGVNLNERRHPPLCAVVKGKCRMAVYQSFAKVDQKQTIDHPAASSIFAIMTKANPCWRNGRSDQIHTAIARGQKPNGASRAVMIAKTASCTNIAVVFVPLEAGAQTIYATGFQPPDRSRTSS